MGIKPGDRKAGDSQNYNVVVNHEEQYSIWPAGREVPRGWRPVGVTGTKDECLAYVKEVWTDMRPLSLREQMSKLADMEARVTRDARNS